MIKIYIDFNFNVLLKLCFSISKKIIFFSPILANNNLPLKIYCENIVIKIDTDFNFNILLKLFFSLSKIFFSPILANNNLPLKIYCEKIVIIFHSSFFFFSLLFFYPPHTAFLSFSFFFPSFFILHTRTRSLFFFILLSSKLQNIQSSPSLSFFFFFFSPFLLALHLLVLGRIDSVPLRFWQRRSIGVRNEDKAVEFKDGEWLRRKGLEIENGVRVGVRVGGFD